MKMSILRSALLAVLFTFVGTQSYAQFGIQAGLSSFDIVEKEISTDVVEKSTYGFHFGAHYRFKVLGLFAEPTIRFNSENIEYTFGDKNVTNTLKDGTYRSVDVPLLVGYKMGPVLLHGGPVAHFSIENSADLANNFEDRFKDSQFGYQVGGGFEIGKARVMLSYEGNFKSSDGTVTLGGVTVDTADRKARVIATVAYDLF